MHKFYFLPIQTILSVQPSIFKSNSRYKLTWLQAILVTFWESENKASSDGLDLPLHQSLTRFGEDNRLCYLTPLYWNVLKWMTLDVSDYSGFHCKSVMWKCTCKATKQTIFFPIVSLQTNKTNRKKNKSDKVSRDYDACVLDLVFLSQTLPTSTLGIWNVHVLRWRLSFSDYHCVTKEYKMFR